MSSGHAEEEIESRNTTINRLRNEISSLRDELETLNNDISRKNMEISRLNQDMFRKGMEDDSRNADEIQRLNSELSNIKFTVSNLQIEIEMKETTITQLRSEARGPQFSSTNSLYSDEDYSRIKEEMFKYQREITNLKGDLMDREYTISQLESRMKHNTRTY